MKEIEGWVRVKKYTDDEGKPVCGDDCPFEDDDGYCEAREDGFNPGLYPGTSCKIWHGESNSEWQPIETAPKGGGAVMVTDPAWVEPPDILLLFGEGKVSVGHWDWYYAEGGNGFDGGFAWIDPISGERLDLHYGAPIGWRPLPLPPQENKP